jgi:simple sugar transport system ATP-binding protein
VSVVVLDGPVLSARGITQRFGSLVANDAVDFDVRSGEVHALLGENGAGKSTLMKVFCGINQPQAGTLEVSGEPLPLGDPIAARRAGIGMVFQDLRLVPALTVLENIELAVRGGRYRRKIARERLRAASERFRIAVAPDRLVRDLSLAERQRVEILRVLMLDASVVILDEPTSALAPQEVDELFGVIHELRSGGLGVVLITHKLRETRLLADRLTVLRRGSVVVGGADPATHDDEALVRAMVGEVPPPLPAERRPTGVEPLLDVRGLAVAGDDGRTAVHDATFVVHRGEIVGVAGVSGNGQRELLEAVVGVRTPMRGTVQIGAHSSRRARPRGPLRERVFSVPEDPVASSVVVGMDVLRHLVLDGQPLPRRGMGIDWRQPRARASARDEPRRLNLAPLHRKVSKLSGGNVQRVVLTRMMLVEDPNLLVVAYPTRGLDIASVRATHRLLIERRDQQAGILLVSEDLDELMTLADRIVVLHGGQVADIVDPATTDRQAIGRLMLQGRVA